MSRRDAEALRMPHDSMAQRSRLAEDLNRSYSTNWTVPSLADHWRGVHSSDHMQLRDLVGVHVFEEYFLEFMVVGRTREKL